VARPEEPKFLGFSISSDRSERRIAPKAVDKFKTRIRNVTRRTREISLPQLIKSWRHTSSDGAATSAAVRPHACPPTWNVDSPKITLVFFGGSGRAGPIASKKCPVVVCQSSISGSCGSPTGSGACQHTPRSNKPRATTISTHSVSLSMSLPKSNLVEPP
jgi:hypothetical protein